MSKQQTVKKCTGRDRLSTDELGLNTNGEKYLACCPDSNYKEITSVEWLFDQLPDHLRLSRNGFDMLQQAKAIHRQQIVDAYFGGYLNGESKTEIQSEQYYNNKYGK